MKLDRLCPFNVYNGIMAKCDDDCMAFKRCQQPEMCKQCAYEPENGSVCRSSTGVCARIVDFEFEDMG